MLMKEKEWSSSQSQKGQQTNGKFLTKQSSLTGREGRKCKITNQSDQPSKGHRLMSRLQGNIF
jgi:hypothetical protein